MSDSGKCQNQDFIESINTIRKVSGKKLLNKDELLYLAADEIARSFTIDETLLSNRNLSNR